MASASDGAGTANIPGRRHRACEAFPVQVDTPGARPYATEDTVLRKLQEAQPVERFTNPVVLGRFVFPGFPVILAIANTNMHLFQAGIGGACLSIMSVRAF